MNEVLKHKIIKFTKHLSSSKLARAFSSSMLVAILSRLSSVGMAIVLARQLSPSGYGAFVYAIGIASLVAQFSTLGWPVLMSRFIPKYMVGGEWGLFKGLVKKGEVVLLFASLFSSAALLYCGKAGFFEVEVSQGLALAALLVPALSFLTLRKSQLAAQKKPAQGLFFNEFIPPTAIIFLSLFLEIDTVNVIFFIFVGFNYLAVLLATLATYRAWPAEINDVSAVSDFKKWMLIALPLIAAISGKMIMSKADILMLVPLSDMKQAGYYGAVFRITYLITFIQVILMTVMSPLISEAIAKNDFALLYRRFVLMIGAAGLFSIPFAIIVFIFRSQIIEIFFGVEYLPGANSLIFLVFAQTVVSFNMPLTSLMIMSGSEKAYGLLMVISLMLNLTLNWLWIPELGAQGAAKATLIANCFSFGCAVIFCLRIMKNYRSNGNLQ